MFKEDSQLVKDYILLINVGEKTLDDVPNVSNLREVIKGVIEKSK